MSLRYASLAYWDVGLPSGGDLAPSLGGRIERREKNSRTKISEYVHFLSRRKFLTFFGHPHQFFQILRFVTVLNVVGLRPFLHKKSHYFIKEFLDKTILNSVRAFARIRQHYLS